MTTTPWTADLETGIAELDADNRTLLGYLDRVDDACTDQDLTRLSLALRALQVQVSVDFAREEQLMADCAFAGAAPHIDEHRRLAAEIQHQIDDLAAGQANVVAIGRFHRNWLRQHILSWDIRLGQAIVTQQGTRDRRHVDDSPLTLAELDLLEERRIGVLEPIAWSARLAVGVEELDAEHRALIERFNAVLAASRGDDRALLAARIDELGEATAAHFATEDALMDGADYAGGAAHRAEHRALLDELVHQVDDWRCNRISADLLCRFMYRWLLRHVVVMDMALGASLQRRTPASPGNVIDAGR